MSILTIPQELLDFITPYLLASSTASLSATCLLLSHRLTHAMHAHAIAHVGHLPALHWAVSKQHKGLTRYLLRYFPPNLSLPNGTTPLHLATASYAPAVLSALLLEHGADANAPLYNGQTPLHVLCKNSRATSQDLQLLLDHGVNVNAIEEDITFLDSDQCSPLAAVMESGRLMRDLEQRDELAVMLLCAGADPNYWIGGNRSALMIAAEEGRVELLEALLAVGANIDVDDIHGRTALGIALDFHQNECARLLLEAGADTKGPDEVRRKALSYLGKEKEVGMVMDVGADGEDRPMIG